MSGFRSRTVIASLVAGALVLPLPGAAGAAVYLGAPTPFDAQTGSSGGADDMLVDDFNGDNDPDIAAVADSWGYISVLLGGPGATFGAPEDYTSESGDTPEISLASDNLGGSAAPEIVSEDGNTWLGDGTGDFIFDTDEDFNGEGGIALGSVNSGSDAFVDAVIATSDTEVEVQLGNGNSTFDPPAENIAVANSWDVVLGSFNPEVDNFADVAIATFPTDDMFVATGNGDGTFDSAEAFDAGPGQWSLIAANLNEDNDPDLLLGDEDEGTVTVFLALPNAAFSAGNAIAAGNGIYGIGAGDFDGDGDADIAAADRDAGDIKVLEGNGSGSFAPPVSFPAGGPTPTTLAVAKLGGDPRPDIVVGTGDGKINVILAEDPPAEDPPPVFKTTVNAKPVSGTVTYTCPGQPKKDLTKAELIPIGCEVDAKAGRMTLTTADAAGNQQSADFYGGSFKMGQVVEKVTKKGPLETITTLTLTGPLKCKAPKGKKGAASSSGAIAYKSGGRGLWGSGKGRYRTGGRRSSATVRGTTWFTKDTCAGTLTKVTEGTVLVDDYGKKKDVTLTQGKSYTAKTKGGKGK